MKNLILIGGGGHCKSCIDVIELENKFNIAGILDVKDKIGKKVFKYDIIGTDSDIDKYINEDYYFLITIGQIYNSDIRTNLYEKMKSKKAKFATIISPRAYVSKYAEIQEGSIIMHDSFINAGCIIGENCIINTKALLEHDVIIGSHTHVSINAVVAGGAKIGKKCFIGANSTIIQNITIQDNSFIKAGELIK